MSLAPINVGRTLADCKKCGSTKQCNTQTSLHTLQKNSLQKISRVFLKAESKHNDPQLGEINNEYGHNIGLKPYVLKKVPKKIQNTFYWIVITLMLVSTFL